MSRALLRYRFRKLRGLPPGDLLRLLSAQAALLWALLLVRTRPTGELVTPSAPASDPADSVSIPGDDVGREARRIALAVERAAEHGVFRATCLVRSVALHRLLQRRGIRDSRIQIGVRMAGGRFEAHAWVEWQGEVLGDRLAHTATFAQLCDVDLAHVR